MARRVRGFCTAFSMLPFALSACSADPEPAPEPIPAPEPWTRALPRPQQLNRASGQLVMGPSTTIVQDPSSADTSRTAELLALVLRRSTGYGLPIVAPGDPTGAPQIRLVVDTSASELGDDGYELHIDSAAAEIRARTPAGVFDGAQTLRQLLPPRMRAPRSTQGPGCWARGQSGMSPGLPGAD